MNEFIENLSNNVSYKILDKEDSTNMIILRGIWSLKGITLF